MPTVNKILALEDMGNVAFASRAARLMRGESARYHWSAWILDLPEGAEPPPVATLSFLAPAARACDDTETAERLEALMTPYLKRDGDDYYLDVGREWRVGATANYIMAVAERHGSRFRDLVRRLCRQRGSGAADAAS